MLAYEIDENQVEVIKDEIAQIQNEMIVSEEVDEASIGMQMSFGFQFS